VISSVRNPKVQALRALQRQAKRRAEAGAFVVEGARLTEEALKSGWRVRLALYTQPFASQHAALIGELQARRVAEQVTEPVMKAASDTQTPQGVLLEVEQRELPLPKALDFALILDGVADPGNLGTLLRSAAAAGCGVVLLGPGCAEPFAPKVMRSGMGAHFLQSMRSLNWSEIEGFLKEHALQIFVAQARQGKVYDEEDLTQPLAFILGGEARGSGKEAARLQPKPIQIPMPGGMESLNVAAAGSVLMFEVVRQRGQKAVRP